MRNAAWLRGVMVAPVCACLAFATLNAGVAKVGAASPNESWSAAAGPSKWVDSLEPISEKDWNYARAAHLLERAGFGGPPEEVARLAAMTPQEAVDYLVDYESIDVSHLPEFDESPNVYPNGHKYIAIQRAMREAATTGKTLGIDARQEGPLPIQPAVTEFYTIMWTDLAEMNRAGQWWAERMLLTPRPFQERMTMFWHDHFATSQDKVHFHRKMLNQIDMLRRNAVGDFRNILIRISQDPAMLIWLDNDENVKGSPNENYAREIMELFTMGEGRGYTEDDIREMARAFTGWTLTEDVTTEPDQGVFVNRPDLHDDGIKTFLGQTGNFDGYDAIDIILEQPETSEYITNKIYRFFVREDISPEMNEELAKLWVEADYELKPLMKTIFLSKDFYSEPSVGTQIKSPVQLIVSTYRKMGLDSIPGIPDYAELCADLGEELFYPPNVSGWAGHKSWINPATLLIRGNFIDTLLFPPDVSRTIPPDKDVHEGYRHIPLKYSDYNITPYTWNNETQRMEPVSLAVYDLYMAGMPIYDALDMMKERGGGMSDEQMRMKMAEEKGESVSQMANITTNESYNLAVGIYNGHVEANDRIKPIPRAPAQVDFAQMAKAAGVETVDDAVEHFTTRFLSTRLSDDRYEAVTEFLRDANGSEDVLNYDDPQIETKLRRLVHLILSAPEYQLG